MFPDNLVNTKKCFGFWKLLGLICAGKPLSLLETTSSILNKVDNFSLISSISSPAFSSSLPRSGVYCATITGVGELTGTCANLTTLSPALGVPASCSPHHRLTAALVIASCRNQQVAFLGFPVLLPVRHPARIPRQIALYTVDPAQYHILVLLFINAYQVAIQIAVN
ncbi:hypothetical protein AYI69_g8006 [Smittium culicis]|uniref:Uncharacterized protein n=1 Tax=Smittium culicis TaxID=133412 RepID=A0A1R1XMY3_9FUNG|nr:hypothetical protein AYI69_g8006 [Smittium culicis]